jgi:hypothetical protein
MIRGLMKRVIALITATTPLVLAAAPPDKDRQAILAMAGTHAVTFEFQETAAVATGYKINPKPYHETATEVVTVVEDKPERIALQHLLIVPGKEGKPQVIKHWAQIWSWQDTELLDYCGSEEDHLWKKIDLTPEQAAGTWSQLVTNIDDTPRYEGYAKWVHEDGESSWQSAATRRPLPRREYSKRDDYDYLVVTNRHTLTPGGWIHYQDNRKVVDRDGEEKRVLCFESGLNSYTRTESPEAEVALAWWKENHAFWDGVRNFWLLSGEKAPASFTYSTHQNGEGLSKLIERLEKEKPAPEVLTSALQSYVVSK